MDETISTLRIEIGASSDKAVQSIEKVTAALRELKKGSSTKAEDPLGGLDSTRINNIAAALKSLKTSVSGKFGNFSKLATELREVANAAAGMEDSVGALAKASQALERLSNLKSISVPKTIGDSIRNIGLAAESVTPDSVANLDSVTRSLQRMSNVNLEGFKSLSGFTLPEIPASAGEAITSIAEAAGQVTPDQLQNLEQFTASLRGLENVDLSGVLAYMREINNQRTRIKVDSKDVDKAHKKVGALANILNSLKRIAFYRVIRTAIKGIGEAFSQGAENAYWYSKTMGDQTKYIADAYDRLSSGSFKMSNQLGAAWATLKATITPILIEIINLVTMAANAMTQFFAVLGGKGTYLKAIDYSKEWADTTAKGAGAAKEWKNQLMGFDEINRLEEPSSGGSGGGSALPNYENMFEESKLSAWAEKVKGTFDWITETVKNHLTEIELFASGALLGIGLVLTLTGANVPLGLGLMAAGAIGLAKVISENWDWISSNVGNALSSVEMVASGFAFGVGLVLALTGANIPLGLGMMAAGALGIATIAALNWDEIPNNVKKVIGDIDLAVGGGLLAVGALLAFSGANIPLGIGLMIGGATALAAGVALNWDYIKQNVTHVLQEIGFVVGGALLALGAVITFATPGFSAIGLGLMIAGAAFLAGAVAVNWDFIAQKMQGTLGLITTIAGGALLALGLVLVFTGVGLPLGLGLMIAGGAALGVGAANYDWDALRKKLQDAWQDIKDWWNSDVAQYFTWSYWQDKFDEAFGNLHITLPHIQISWEEATGAVADVLGYFGIPLSIPHIGVEWYAKGGIVDGATLIGAGEAGKEAIIPLERNTEWISRVAAELNTQQARQSNGYGGADIGAALEDANDSVINAIFAVGTQLVQAIAENSNNGQVDWNRVTNEVTRRQRQMARANG